MRRSCVSGAAVWVMSAVTAAFTPLGAQRATEPTPSSALVVVSKTDRTLAIIDPSTQQILAKVSVGEDPHEVAVSSDGRTAFVSNYGGGAYQSISRIDLVSQTALRPIDLGPLRGPHGLAFDSQGRLFVADRGNRRIQVFNTDGKYLREFTIDVPVDTTRGKIVFGAETPNAKTGSQAPGAPDALCMTPGPNPVLFVGDLYPTGAKAETVTSSTGLPTSRR